MLTGVSVTTREPEYSPADQAQLLSDWEREHQPRGSHGVPMDEATDEAFNPYSLNAKGRFVAEPVADFAQAAIDKAAEVRRKATGDDDWPLVWDVRLERYDNES